MTAEVAIANASAIALAADSAVTIGDQKIYNSALKLFSLSKVSPVGVMVYGNAGLLSVPWETLIKTYRHKSGDKTYDTLEQYAVDFLEYLNDSPDLFPIDSQKRWLLRNVSGYFSLIRDEFFEKLHPIIQEKGQVSIEETAEAIRAVVNEHHSRLKGQEYAEGMTSAFERKVRSKYLKEFKELREVIFEKAKVASATAAKLYDIATFIQTRQIFSMGVSGLVIAGYGESEIYPSVLTFDIEGVVENKLKYRRNQDKSHTITSGSECRIIAFAQEDMVTTFMNGINPQVFHFLQSYLGETFRRLPELLDNEKIGMEGRKRFRLQTSKLLRGLFDRFGEHLRDEHSQPVLRMVTVLPKDELAAMAEALVNLTAFKRRITESMETVGGPIDVAVISKGDGLIWVKRKHYFPADLNQHFFANYFRGLGNERTREE
ncbi:hypothetical protein QLQ85_11180 [Halomonas sp. M4R5S39]|uniref:hypothetical protein n=1 Tax=Halomonas kalidii TaxID=3043293 RepID=UPI0024A91E68|nr:hypothetical protein [Halomonas kalidii]MDI5985355.1 hypothetical protein [Halomonas kalidii]